MTTQPPTTWAIRDWDKAFTCRQAANVKTWRWVPWPVKLDGYGYRVLASTREGLMALGVFAALVEVAANLPRRGVLAVEYGPLDSIDLGIRTGVPAVIIEEAIVRLSDARVQWLIPWTGNDTEVSPKPASDDTRGRESVTADMVSPHTPHPSREEEKRKEETRDECSAGGAGPGSVPVGLDGMDGKAGVRRALQAHGINGPNLNRLVVAVSVEEIKAEAQRVMADRTVRNVPGVLAARLAQAKGIELEPRRGSVRGLAGCVDRETAKYVEQLEQLKKNRGIA